MHAANGDHASKGNGGSSTEEWMIEVKDRMFAPSTIPHTNQQPAIFHVPEVIRSSDPGAYTPQLVSIGPYHHRGTLADNEITLSLQDYKLKSTRFFLCPEGSGDYSLIYKCLEKIEKELVPDARGHYSTGLTSWTDRELAEMMLHDGCFILRCVLERRVAEQAPLLGMVWIWKVVKYDLLMLENQIPFFVLEELFKFIKEHGVVHSPTGVVTAEDPSKLIDLVLDFFGDIRPSKSKSFDQEARSEHDKYFHLLHIFHSSLLPCGWIGNEEASKRGRSLHDPPMQEWIPSATELQQGGVVFRDNKSAASFLDVRFNRGVMEIPSVRITDHSGTIFRNLMAFEQCFPYTEAHITAYAVFMDCLIDTPGDAALLDSKGILVNRLSTDEAMAKLFNSLTYQLHYALDGNYPRELFAAVNQYHQSKWHRYRAVLIRDYFSSPWTIVSVIAATILLLLNIVITFYTVYPYYHHRE